MEEVKMFSYSSMILSIYCCCIEGPCLEVLATVFFSPWGHIIRKTKFSVLEMSLLHFFAVTKEMVVGSAIFAILYNVFPKVTVTTQGLYSYTTCHFHKYGSPNNTSQTKRGSTSHNTSSMKGSMLYGKWRYWLMPRSHPWWSHLTVCGCGCAMVGKPNRFMTSAKIRFFCLPLLTMNCSREPFTHIWDWKRCSSSYGYLCSSF